MTKGVNLHIERGEFTRAYEIAHKAIDIDRNDPGTMQLMVKAMKAMKSPSLKSFAKSITLPWMTKNRNISRRFWGDKSENQLSDWNVSAL